MLQLDTRTRAARMLEAGRVTVTFRSPSGQHITILAKCRGIDPNTGRWVNTPLAEAKVIFFEVPNSGDWNDKVGKFTAGKGFVPERTTDDARAYCANMLLRFVQGQELPPSLEAMESSNCGRCGRTLTDPVSIERGIGPECYGMITGSQHETKVKNGRVLPEVEPGERASLRSSANPASTIIWALDTRPCCRMPLSSARCL